MKEYFCEQNFVTTVHVTHSWQILNQNLDQEEAESASRYIELQLMNKKHPSFALLLNVVGDSQI